MTEKNKNLFYPKVYIFIMAGWLKKQVFCLIIAHTEISCWRPDQDWWLSPIGKSQTVSALIDKVTHHITHQALSHQNYPNGLNTSLITRIGACSREHIIYVSHNNMPFKCSINLSNKIFRSIKDKSKGTEKGLKRASLFFLSVLFWKQQYQFS